MPTANPEQPAPDAVAQRVRVLLVDDQPIVGETVRRMLADEPDMDFLYCAEPTKAIAVANEFRPTVILQDLVMPDIDGLMLVKFFRANAATRDIPMIVLSSKEEPIVKADAFALGANDYLVKLPDKIEVIARVRYHSRGYIHLLERNEAYRRLEENRRQLAAELAQAAQYVESQLPAPLEGDIRIGWKFVPSVYLGGDMFGYHWLDPDHLAIYLLDVSGHGVGSSLLAVSAANVLSYRTLPETDFRDPAQVLARLNDVFQMERQNEKYFTIWYGVYDRAGGTLTYGNAGHPPALVLPASGGPPRELGAIDPWIGMLPPGMDFSRETVPVGPGDHLLVFSDGVYEIEQSNGTMWPFAEFVGYVAGACRTGPGWVDGLLDHVRGLHGSSMLADDFSMMEVRL